MDFRDTPEESAFRSEVREFLRTNLPPVVDRSWQDWTLEEGAEEPAFMARWRKVMAERRWIVPHWPKVYGGAGLTTIEQFIFNEEMATARAPAGLGGSGAMMLGPTLIIYGSEEQKQQFLPPIAAGEVTWCQGYSEPGAGSDLASLQTRAVRDGDDYVINGQKIWTSLAHRADWMFMLARTDPSAPKHRGISMFLLDMKSPGLTVSPLVDMSGGHMFNQVFFDNVRAPAKQMVGDENRGWYLGATLLDFERSNIAGAIALKNAVDDLAFFLRDNEGKSVVVSNSASIRFELAERALEAEVAKLFAYRIVTMQKEGKVPNYEASVAKLFVSEAQQRIYQTGTKLLGPYAGLWRGSKWAPQDGRIAHQYVQNVYQTIAAGTSEIQRNIIAQRGLGMPRD